MLNWLKQFARPKYVRLLEEEVTRERAENERLRAENRALLNSLLGTAGFPPVEFPEAPKPQPLPRLRKRSWRQIQAWREAEARREPSADSAFESAAAAAGANPLTAGNSESTESRQNGECGNFARTNGPVPHS